MGASRSVQPVTGTRSGQAPGEGCGRFSTGIRGAGEGRLRLAAWALGALGTVKYLADTWPW